MNEDKECKKCEENAAVIRPKCASCKSAMVYMRITSKELVCRSCGVITAINKPLNMRSV